MEWGLNRKVAMSYRASPRGVYSNGCPLYNVAPHEASCYVPRIGDSPIKSVGRKVQGMQMNGRLIVVELI